MTIGEVLREGCLGPAPWTVWLRGSRSHIWLRAVKREGRAKDESPGGVLRGCSRRIGRVLDQVDARAHRGDQTPFKPGVRPTHSWLERMIGYIRRECLDHVIVLSEKQLRRVLKSYFAYYHRSRTHLGLVKDCPEPRPVEPPDRGLVRSEPRVGGLHHRYFHQAA